jgi:hypothetical protein
MVNLNTISRIKIRWTNPNVERNSSIFGFISYKPIVLSLGHKAFLLVTATNDYLNIDVWL